MKHKLLMVASRMMLPVTIINCSMLCSTPYWLLLDRDHYTAYVCKEYEYSYRVIDTEALTSIESTVEAIIKLL